MVQCIGIPLTGLRVDGGPTANKYLMQFQSDIANTSLLVSALQDLSGFGAAIAAGTHMGLYNGDTLKQSVRYTGYHPERTILAAGKAQRLERCCLPGTIQRRNDDKLRRYHHGGIKRIGK